MCNEVKKTSIVINLQIEGMHYWKEAKEKLPEVAFLSHPHRHIFHIKAKKDVSHDDRDIEIIMFKNKIERYLKDRYGFFQTNFQGRSCEMIASELLDVFDLNECEVLEDGENGAQVIKTTKNWKRIVVVCGYPCSGKETFINNHLKQANVIKVSSIVQELKQSSKLSDLNDSMHLDCRIVEILEEKIIKNPSDQILVIDGIRQATIVKDINVICKRFAIPIEYIWLDVPMEELKFRFEQRKQSRNDMTFEEVVISNKKMGIDIVKDLITLKNLK